MATVAGPYEYTATGILGDKRDTMLQNQLLLRCELGKPMRRGYTQYPGDTYRFGQPNEIRDGGAAEALRGWGGWGSSSLPLPGINKTTASGCSKDPRPGRDFMALNKAAVQAGLTTAKQLYQFRATNDIRRRVQAEGGIRQRNRRLPPSMIFGIPTRPSTPIHDLLEHKYQDRWLQERRSAELAKQHKDETQRLTPGKVCGTRATQLRVHQVPVESAPLWKMPRFTKNPNPHLETFRSERAKSAAFTRHQSDCISRKGFSGHGVYEQAKN